MGKDNVSNAAFLRWMNPILVALRELNGSATPKQVRDRIAVNESLTKEELRATRGKTKVNKFENEVAFARTYLVSAGYIENSKRGIWSLTEEGRHVEVTKEMASQIFKEKQNETKTNNQFVWNDFYIELANQLLKYKNNRSGLIEELKEIFADANLNFPFKEKGVEIYEDICPFTIFGSFNKGLTNVNRTALLLQFAKHFNITKEVPTVFDGIPVVMNLSAWFFSYKGNRNDDDIDNLWNLFESAIDYADDPTVDNKSEFLKKYDLVIKQKMIKWNITMGLYWIRPYSFINLDAINRNFITDVDYMPYDFTTIFHTIKNGVPDGASYLLMCEQAKNALKNEEYKYHSFPELSYGAWRVTKELSDKQKNATIDSDVKEISYWVYSPGDNACMWDDFSKNNIMGIGYDEFNVDLKTFSTKDSIKEKLKNTYGENYSYKNTTHCLWQFANEMKIGDVVFAKKGAHKIIGRGIVKSDYIYDTSRDTYRQIRKVEWTNIGEWEHPGQAVTKTLTNVTAYSDYVADLISLFVTDTTGKIQEEKEIKYPIYTKDDFLEEVFLEEETYDTLVDLLDTKYNIILQGAPGVGKTFVAKRLAYSIMGEKDTSRVSLVQFHQSYSYEDFIQGYRPAGNSFKLGNGTFYKFCKEAEEDNERLYFFIIDEINRGNLSKILGELMMLIEKDKRGEKVTLLYSNEKFTVPDNVRIIGMMNTADRSLALIDYALRRRFAFFDFAPAFSTQSFKTYIESKENEKLDKLISTVENLNKAISNDESLGEGFQIGHSYFCTDKEVTDKWLNSVVEYEIIPLLKEYWFDEPTKVKDWTSTLRSALT